MDTMSDAEVIQSTELRIHQASEAQLVHEFGT